MTLQKESDAACASQCGHDHVHDASGHCCMPGFQVCELPFVVQMGLADAPANAQRQLPTVQTLSRGPSALVAFVTQVSLAFPAAQQPPVRVGVFVEAIIPGQKTAAPVCLAVLTPQAPCIRLKNMKFSLVAAADAAAEADRPSAYRFFTRVFNTSPAAQTPNHNWVVSLSGLQSTRLSVTQVQALQAGPAAPQ
jgi:hypothetical protein